MTTTHRGRHQVSPRVEELEDRRLLSVSVLPGRINLKSAGHGHGVFTVRVVPDGTQATTDLLGAAPGSLTLSVLDASGNSTPLGQPRSSRSGGDGLVLKFSRSAVGGLSSGTYQVQVSDGTAADTETGTVTLFNPGRGHTHGHGHHDHGHHDHGHGHGHGKGHDHGPPPGHGG
jgi:hypothetical protein